MAAPPLFTWVRIDQSRELLLLVFCDGNASDHRAYQRLGIGGLLLNARKLGAGWLWKLVGGHRPALQALEMRSHISL